MKFSMRALAVTTVYSATAAIGSGATVHWDQVELMGEFRSAPERSLCGPTTSSCEDPVFEGQIRIHASRDANGYLTDFQVTINDELLALGIVEQYQDAADFRLSEMSITYVAAYVPMRARGRVMGLGLPSIRIVGLSHVDSQCEFEIRAIEVMYLFETNSVEIVDWCVGSEN